MQLSLISIFLSLVLLTILVFKRFNIILASFICCVFIALLSSMDLVNAMMPAYLKGFASFIQSNYLIFAFSALFGKLMEETGAAYALATLLCKVCGKRFALYGAMLATSILTYGGVSVFVIVFAVYPIFLSIAEQSDIPRYLLPAAMAAAAATYAEAFFPGAAQIHNIIPTTYLGTTTMAGAIVGTICGVLDMIMLYFYFEYELKKCRKKGIHFEHDEKTRKLVEKLKSRKTVNGLVAFIPIIVLLVLLNVLKANVVVAMISGCLVALVLFWRNIPDKLDTLSVGINSATGAIVATSSVIAFGAVIKDTSGYQAMINWVMNLKGNPLMVLGLTSTLISGITGSGAGGISFTMEIFTDHFLSIGVNPQMFHRIVTMAGVGLDSLPHNGLIVTTLNVADQTHKQAYKPIFITTLVFTMILLFLAILIGPIFYPNLT